jgi:hypothetical protein
MFFEIFPRKMHETAKEINMLNRLPAHISVSIIIEDKDARAVFFIFSWQFQQNNYLCTPQTGYWCGSSVGRAKD